MLIAPNRRNPSTWSIELVAHVSVAVFGCLALIVCVALIGTSSLVKNSTSMMDRDVRSLEVGHDLERYLTEYLRASTLAGQTHDARFVARREVLRKEIEQLLAEAHRCVAGADEAVLLDELSAAIQATISGAKSLDKVVSEAPQILEETTPVLQRIRRHLDQLSRLNEQDVERAHDRLLAMNRFDYVVVASTSSAILVGLLAIILITRWYIVGPLIELRDSVLSFRSAGVNHRQRSPSMLEIRQIGRAFDELSDALQHQRAERLSVLAGVAHDMRGPVMASKVAAKAIRGAMRGPVEGDVGAALTVLERQLERWDRMVGDLLDSTRIEAGQLDLKQEVIDLRPLVEGVIRLQTTAATTHPVRGLAGDEPVLVNADPLRFEQVVTNLVSNAVKYSSHGSPVDVCLRCEGLEALLEVADRGVGISAGEVADIFQPFMRRVQTREMAPGHGLGLSVVRRIVEAHHGRIEVESVPGEGSTFRVRLPLHRAAEG